MGHRPYPSATRARNQLWRRYQTPAFTTSPMLAALAESTRPGPVQLPGLTAAEAVTNLRSWADLMPGL